MEAPTPGDDLPDQAIHKILSFLPPKDAIRSSSISQQWRSAWVSSSLMVFDETSVPFNGSDFFDFAERSLQLWLDRCDALINQEKLSLCAHITSEQFFSRFVNLVAMAKNRNLKVLELQSCSKELWVLFNSASLWSLLLQSETLKEFSLRNFGILISSSLVVKTSSLKKLIVSCSCIDDNSLDNLLSCFPLLEDLALRFCYGFYEIWITCPKLRTMELTCHTDPAPNVVIKAENLESLVYGRGLKSPGGIKFLSCKYLTSLQFKCVNFGPLGAIEYYICQVPLLENLALLDCGLTGNETGLFLMSHSNLKKLKIQRCSGLLRAEIKTPSLCFFKYCGPIFEVVTFRYCSSGLVKAEVELKTGSMEHTEWFWFIKMRNFLETFSKCESLTLHCYVQGFPKEFGKLGDHCLVPDPLYEMRHLNFTNRKLPIEDYACFIDVMIKLFPRAQTLFLRTDLAKIFIEFAEDKSFSLNWKDTINTLDIDEKDTIFQSINQVIDNIVKWLSLTGKGTSNRTDHLHPHTLI